MLGVAEESVRVGCGENGIDGHLHIAGGCVLEAHGTRNSGDEFAMDLTLCGTGADGAPTDEAGDVLRRDHVKEFGACGYTRLREIEEEIAREAEAVVDFVGAV